MFYFSEKKKTNSTGITNFNILWSIIYYRGAIDKWDCHGCQLELIFKLR